MIKHEHYDTIVAWAGGAQVERYEEAQGWYWVEFPCFKRSARYRIRHTPKPDIVHEVLISLSPYAGPLLHAASPLDANCVLVFDGETGKLKQCSLKGA